MMKSTDQFISLQENPVINYEKGSEVYAGKIAVILDSSMQVIETKQGSFSETTAIYIPASIEEFGEYCVSEKPAACVIGDRLFLSPRLFSEKERIPGILTHELSHLQLTQAVGRWNFQNHIPVWFKEGLAVFVSSGGGAENVSIEEAKNAILSGKSIVPNNSGSLFSPHTARHFNMKPHMFYRQSSLFVGWLYNQNGDHFKQLFHDLHNGDTLGEAVKESYGFTLREGWSTFLTSLEKPVKASFQHSRLIY